LSNDHPQPQPRITSKPLARKPKAPDDPKVAQTVRLTHPNGPRSHSWAHAALEPDENGEIEVPIEAVLRLTMVGFVRAPERVILTGEDARKLAEIGKERELAWLYGWASEESTLAEAGLRQPLRPLPRPLTRHVELRVSRYLQLINSRRSYPIPPRGIDDLERLVEIGQLVSKGTSAWKAAGTVAERIGGSAPQRHANRKRLYDHYRTDAAIYLRIAQAADAEACINEIITEAVSR
jgi:hypothetical protein